MALAVLLLYSYTKRFTAASHLVLGLALAGAPLGAWIAVRGDLTLAPVVLGAAVLLWVAGFDILYSLQDLELDRKAGLHSIPARLGVVPALWVSAAFHAAMLGLLTILPRVYPRAWVPAGGSGWRGARSSSPTSIGSWALATCPASMRPSSPPTGRWPSGSSSLPPWT